MTATIGNLPESASEKEKISVYLERMELFFTTNGNKQVLVLLTAIGGETYGLLRSLLNQVQSPSQN